MASPRYLSTFLPREMELSGLLHHPSVIKHHGQFSQGNFTCLAMELAARGDLEQYITLKGPIRPAARFDPGDQAHTTCRQILEGLGFIHSLGIVHRDLKCENILLDETLAPKIADFGFARRQGPEELSRTYCGSPSYIAPEVVAQLPYKGRPADLWSVGVIVFIILSARMPFDDADMAKMLQRQREGRIPFARDYFDASAKAFIQSLLAADPEQRPSTAQALRHQWFTGHQPH